MIELDILRIKNSPGAEYHLVKEFDMQPIQTELEEVFFNTPVRLDVNVANRGSFIAIEGTFEANIKIACGRCLDLFDLPVREEIKEFYYNTGKMDAKPEEDGEDWIPYRGDSIDVTPEVARTIVASLPMKLLCRDDCQGLCQICGENLNTAKCECHKDEVDIRLVKLKQLLEKDQ
ncbi:MAG: hypothetical protein JL50_13755 [Peptococcaceae bacterium BICA1-7]|nr:MAG: hypothetical protein JL50_13755 [Peptococcaceae bacterium BICA1-7]